MHERRQEAWAKWRGLVSEQAGSGQTVAGFCKERGIPASQFFAWKRKVRQAAGEPFVEVQLARAAPPQPPVHGRGIEVRLSGGHCILVEPGFDADHLRAVVTALEMRA